MVSLGKNPGRNLSAELKSFWVFVVGLFVLNSVEHSKGLTVQVMVVGSL